MEKILYGMKQYPNKLMNIPNPPEQLYVKGNNELLNTIAIAVIGTRSPSEYGKRMCRRFTKELVQYGITIVSGMAKGIDSIAHKTCLINGGNTIAVLPTGFDNIYPKTNYTLYKNIINSNGTAITEYMPEEGPEPKKFLKRNRIVSGLCIGTLVIEAGYRSGTSVTARITMEQGRKIFSVPSSLDNKKGITSNLIIQKGAKLVTCIEDILEEFADINFEKNEDMDLEKNISDEYKAVYNAISWKPQHINILAKKLNCEISDINYKLMMLELDEYIEKLPGNFYIRK